MKFIHFFCLLILWGLPVKAATELRAPVIYGVSPFYFSEKPQGQVFKDIQNRLPEIQDLGAQIVWLQPVFPAAQPGQGYDTLDAFRLNPQFGTEKDFRELISTAHRMGMKIILDVALNHLPREHPYAQDVIKKGVKSEYHGFFQMKIDPLGLYSHHAKIRKDGKGQFVHYFWESFYNLNFNHPRVRNYAFQVLEHWVKSFDVDGFRLDASWGPQDRWPEFYQELGKRLRPLKSDLFLLVEDSARVPIKLKSTKRNRFHDSLVTVAYDWDVQNPRFLSKWSFQWGDDEKETVFNLKDPVKAAKEFARQVTYSRESEAPVLRYLQNNDSASFLFHHSVAQTKFAAAAVLLLPGVPLIYYGQEMGLKYPQWHLPSINSKTTLRSQNEELWTYYRGLLRLKRNNAVLREGRIQSVEDLGKGQVSLIYEWKRKTVTLHLDFSKMTVKLNQRPLEKMLMN